MRNVLWLTVAGSLVACGGPARDGEVSAELLQSVAQGVTRAEGRVKAEELARWIIEGRKDFALFDLRSPDAFALGHIQGAENVRLTDLLTPDKLASLPAGQKIVVYAQRSEEADAAATLLRVAGRDGVVMLGGYEAWGREVLNPADVPTVGTAGEAPAIAEKRAIACYFIGGQAAAAPMAAAKPKPVVAAPPAAAKPKAPREGC